MMIDSLDTHTVVALHELLEVARRRSRPLLLWIGAGASRWNGYPSWKELAERLYKKFNRSEPHFNGQHARSMIDSGRYPDLFSVCKATSAQRYRMELSDALRLRAATPVYQRFLCQVARMSPLYLVTTNVDECIERHSSGPEVIHVEAALDHVVQRQAFMVKLHGTISAIDSVVMTTEEYAVLLSPAYVESLIQLIRACSILFLGYGLGDEYLIHLLEQQSRTSPVFGNGPHFVVAPRNGRIYPAAVRVLQYTTHDHPDHRSALSVLDLVVPELTSNGSPVAAAPIGIVDDASIPSAHYISDVYPPGVVTTQQTVEAIGEDGTSRIHATIGPGYQLAELPTAQSTAGHDLAVGILCFDRVYLSLDSLPRLHSMLGSQVFWRVIESDVLRFVFLPQYPAIGVAGNDGEEPGEIIELTPQGDNQRPRTILDELRLRLQPAPGQETEGMRRIEGLESLVETVPSIQSHDLALTIRSCLLNPRLRRLIGMSEATPIHSIPMWMKYPVLRVADSVKCALVCNGLRLPSTKLLFGGERLAEEAFFRVCATEHADRAGAYVVSGQFYANLQPVLERNPNVVLDLLTFRDSNAGVMLRAEVRSLLDVHAGADLVAAINGGLHRSIPTRVLQMARDTCLGVLSASGQYVTGLPSLIVDPRLSDESFSRWRVRSLAMLREYCGSRRRGSDASCPCGSGEVLRDCCEAALRL